jgi:cytolysin (calcineurin-like family phosphatase)
MTKRLLFVGAPLLVLVGVIVVASRPPSWLRAVGLTPAIEITGTPRARRGGMDVTFLVAADTHLGFEGHVERNRAAVQAMNGIEGTAFPDAVAAAAGKPIGLLVAGDLTEDGRPEEWASFLDVYREVPFPLFETIGNHDKHYGWYVKERVAERHGSVRYSWDWHDLHLVSLGEAPDDEDLAWLAADLEGVGHDVGVVLFFHFALLGPFSRGNWFGDAHHPDALHRTLQGYRVLGIFHGHFHGGGHYEWRGFDVYNPGSVAKHGMGNFGVVRVTDERMIVGSWSWERRLWTWWHQKAVFGGAAREVGGDIRR